MKKLVLTIALAALFGHNVQSVTVYVAPDGNDGWTGTDEKADGRKEGPVATLVGARDAVRRLRISSEKADMPVTVVFADGVYSITRPVIFTPEDSGVMNAPVRYVAARDTRPVITGGRTITGWRKDAERACWVADLPAAGPLWEFRQLFINGRPAIRARQPNAEDYWTTIEKQLEPYTDGVAIYRDGDIRNWAGDLTHIEMFLMRAWDISIFKMASVDETNRIVRLNTGVKEGSMGRWRRDRRYFLENSLRFLDAPGEWFLDVVNRRVYLKPFDEAAFKTAVVTAPVVDRLAEFRGEPGKPVEHISFAGLTFTCSDWTLPEGGYNGHQADVASGAAITADYVRGMIFEDCLFSGLGNYALWFRQGCTDNCVRGCEFADLGGGAVLVGENARAGITPLNPTTRNEISDCHIHDCGRIWRGACGIWVGPANYTVIRGNHIHDLSYSGISVGWTWADVPSGAHHNTIERNYIHHVMMLMGDGGAIYTLGRQDGTVVRGNVMHDIIGWHAEGNGIYTDQGTSGLLIENNFTARTGWGGIGCGTHDMTVRNNIVVFAGRCALSSYKGDRRNWERNVVYQREGKLVCERLEGEDNRFDHNLYHHTTDPNPFFPGKLSFDEWQKVAHQDEHSLSAPPRFKDIDAGDFNLLPDSPAMKLGFVPFPIPIIGPEGPDPRDSERLRKLFRLKPKPASGE